MGIEPTATIESPCVGVCRVDGKFCSGCYRTIGEIGAWSAMSSDDKRLVLQKARQRRESN
ncbi:MAG: DUF1289 domain-containing protein [Proteobacteria bacterium]|nr:DUF1289 domain-containing protein [Pseudomonadota bacterium]